jgi:acyl carrier protein
MTFDAIAERVADILSVSKERIGADTLLSDLSTDSLAIVEVSVDLQEEFDLVITQEEFATVHTFGDLVSLVQSRR